jgi:hypothetical protein
VETFDDVPKEFFAPQEEKKTSTYQSQNTYGFGGYGNCGYNDNDWKKKQEEREKQKKKEEKMRWTPTLIKRKGDLPALKIMNALKKKIVAISTGDYEDPLPFLEGDPEEKDDKKTKTA